MCVIPRVYATYEEIRTAWKTKLTQQKIDVKVSRVLAVT